MRGRRLPHFFILIAAICDFACFGRRRDGRDFIRFASSDGESGAEGA
jgi:hypothetical protein